MAGITPAILGICTGSIGLLFLGKSFSAIRLFTQRQVKACMDADVVQVRNGIARKRHEVV